ncbi:MAG: hypothetical protein COV35_09460 [Alphaproteobacteria bacterium CG11_big_fil_rev_8_21_14_0_20_39_49]|nr:MAG: hypothetical protein COV35_09460 [Alphaproteobacteria bacterium CG11_big_fil_rev_8_21_14_0_20_39_49]
MFIKKKIPVSKTNLPHHSDIYPYLQDIKNDDSTCGRRPLVNHLKTRFQELFGTEKGTVAITSNAVYALANTLKALDVPANSYCLMPSWCSPSIPYAATYAGLTPYFVDVDNDTWTLDVKNTVESLMYIKQEIGAVIVPSSIGETINTKEWDKFTEETGVPVIIGASNSFDNVTSQSKSVISDTPIVVGFNHNSLLCFGEGAVIVSKNKKLIEKIDNISTFGFGDELYKIYIGTNGIMTEYNAAVCHAALDSWDSTRAKWNTINNYYIETFIETTLQHRLSFEYLSSTCNIYLLANNADSTIDYLKSKGIEARKWTGNGCHNMKEFQNAPKTSLPVTENLISSVIGLPYYLGITKKDIELVVRTLSSNVYGKKIHFRNA